MSKTDQSSSYISDKKGATILIIEDNPSNLKVVVAYLEETDFDCMVARTGERGLELAGLEPPDLILLDVLMPGIDGFEVCRRLKAVEATRNIPVLFMTALTSVEDKVKGLEAGGADYLTKPIQQEELLARINTQLEFRALTHHLEDLVAERTADLRKTNEELHKEVINRKKVEEEIVKYAAELEESNRIKDLFTDIMRHDLMNPAGVIINFAEILHEREDDDEKKELIEFIRDNSHRIVEMVENASIYSRLQYLEELDREMLCLGEILKDNVLNFAFDLKEKDMRVQFDPEGEYPLKANRMIRSVFSNLISNAIKYGDKDSTVEIGIDDEEGNWLVYVKNSGEGIVDEEKGKIFERFERAGITTIKGTGLGLAIAKRIVALHSGRIWVEDNPERGSIFFVSLPKAHNV